MSALPSSSTTIASTATRGYSAATEQVSPIVTSPPGRSRWFALAAFAVPLGLYIATLAPTIYNLDSAELTTAAATGGLVRATGYPLYLLLGRLWAQLPLGDVGYRMNLFSAFWGAVTIALCERMLARLRVGLWPTVAALGLLLSAPFFWALSLVAEVYTLHTAMMSLVLLALLGWGESPRPWRLGACTFLVGLGAGNQAAMILLAPGCLWFVLRHDRQRALRLRAIFMAAAGLLAGLSIYLYLPYLYLRNPAFNYAGSYDAAGRFIALDLTRPANLWSLMSGRGFGSLMLGYGPGELAVQLRHYGVSLWRAFFGIGIVPALLGAMQLWRRHRALAGALSLIFLLNVLFFVGYRVVDKETMFLPTYVVWALWLAVGYQTLADWIVESRAEGGAGARAWPLHAIAVAAAVGALAWNLPLVDLSREETTRKRGEIILARVEPNAIVLGYWATVPALQYLQLVEGRRPDVLAINRFLISPTDTQRLVRAQALERPIYFDYRPGSSLGVEVVPVWPLYRVVSKGSDGAGELDESVRGSPARPGV